MKLAAIITALGVSLVMTGILFAQGQVHNLQDLVGAKGRDAEGQMEQRGYSWVRTEKSDDSAYSYWRDNRSGKCINVRTSQGRYASIVYTPDLDCNKDQGGNAQGDNDQDYNGQGDKWKDKFQTICGVMVDGQSYSYRCKVVDVYHGDRKIKTVLHFPDQTMQLQWQPNNELLIRQKGMQDRSTRYSTSEGETNFRLDRNTYFYISNKDAARLEVEHFRD